MPEARENTSFDESTDFVCSICFDLSNIRNFDVARRCPHCHRFFCKNHTSSVDPSYCDNCLRSQSVATTIEDGLLDEDGVKHEGKRITLTGEFWASMTVDVRTMSDQELENYIISLKAAVREIEIVRDYRKIALAHGENELEERKIGKLRRLRLVKDVRSGRLSAEKVVEMKRSSRKTKSNLDAIAEAFKAAGVTKEQLAVMIAGIQKEKK
jgi:hypothetical protein